MTASAVVFSEILKNTCFIERLQMNASEYRNTAEYRLQSKVKLRVN